jgi:hypothetical protein
MSDENDVTQGLVDPNAGDQFYNDFDPRTLAGPLARSLGTVAHKAVERGGHLIDVLGSDGRPLVSGNDLRYADLKVLVVDPLSQVPDLEDLFIQNRLNLVLDAMAAFNDMSNVKNILDTVPMLLAMVQGQHLVLEAQKSGLYRKILLIMEKMSQGFPHTDPDLDILVEQGGLSGVYLIVGGLMLLEADMLIKMHGVRHKLSKLHKRLGEKSDTLDELADLYESAENARASLITELNSQTAEMINTTIEGPDVATRVAVMKKLAADLRKTNQTMKAYGEHTNNSLGAILTARMNARSLHGEYMQYVMLLHAYGEHGKVVDILNRTKSVMSSSMLTMAAGAAIMYQRTLTSMLSDRASGLQLAMNEMEKSVIQTLENNPVESVSIPTDGTVIVDAEGRRWILSPNGSEYLPVDEAGGE